VSADFLLDCPKYESVRGELWRRLEDEMAPDCWHMMQQMQIEEKAYKLLDFNFLGGSVLADIVAPYVYACWQIRWKVGNEEVRSDDEREADGSGAMV
jgi:hypothetical protein